MWYKISNAPADKRKNLIFWSTAGVIIGTLVVLAATGRMHWLYAIGGAIAGISGWILLRRSGTGWRVGRILASAPRRRITSPT